MAFSNVDLSNLALYNAGSAERIDTLTESSVTTGRELVRKCAFLLPYAREALLELAPWGFARKSIAMAAVADTAFPGWTYVYEYPSDCIHAAAVCDAGGMRTSFSWWSSYACYPRMYTPPKIPFQVGSRADGSSNVIMTDIASAYLYYVFRQENPTTYSPLFRDALAWELAFRLSQTLQGGEANKQRCDVQRQIALNKAMTQLMNEAQQDIEPDSPSIAVRG